MESYWGNLTLIIDTIKFRTLITTSKNMFWASGFLWPLSRRPLDATMTVTRNTKTLPHGTFLPWSATDRHCGMMVYILDTVGTIQSKSFIQWFRRCCHPCWLGTCRHHPPSRGSTDRLICVCCFSISHLHLLRYTCVFSERSQRIHGEPEATFGRGSHAG